MILQKREGNYFIDKIFWGGFFTIKSIGNCYKNHLKSLEK